MLPEFLGISEKFSAQTCMVCLLFVDLLWIIVYILLFLYYGVENERASVIPLTNIISSE